MSMRIRATLLATVVAISAFAAPTAAQAGQHRPHAGYGPPAWHGEGPRTGFVKFDSDYRFDTEVWIDGRRMFGLDSDGGHEHELRVGWHEMVVRDEYGRMLDQAWFAARPYETVYVDFGTKHYERVYTRDARDHD